VSASIQYEAWDFPIIAATRQDDVATSIQFTWWPVFGQAHSGGSAGQEGRSAQ
jgi:hypothetical protein